MKTNRIIRTFSLTFPNNSQTQNFWQFEKILSHFGLNVDHLTLSGSLTDHELFQLMSYTTNCKTLNLDKFCIIKTKKPIHCLNLTHLSRLEIDDNVNVDLTMFLKDNDCTKFEFFNSFRLPDNSIKTFKYTTNSRGNFEILNRLLENQANLEELEITADYLSTIIPEVFLSGCRLKKLVIKASILKDVVESFEEFKLRQSGLEVVEVIE
jgi:hypothetical protein